MRCYFLEWAKWGGGSADNASGTFFSDNFSMRGALMSSSLWSRLQAGFDLLDPSETSIGRQTF